MENTKKLDISAKTLMHYAIMIAIMAVFFNIPEKLPITHYGWAALGIFVGLVYGWTFIGMLGPSLIGFGALTILNHVGVMDTVVGFISNNTVLMMLFGCLAFDALRQTAATDYVLGKLMSSSIAKKSAVMLVGVIFAAVIILGALGMGVVLQFVLFPIMNDFLEKCGYKKGEKFCNLFLMGYMISTIMAIGIFPFYSWGLMIAGSFAAILQYAIPIGPYVAVMIIVSVIYLVTYPLAMKLLGCDFSKLQNVNIEETFHISADAKLNVAQKIAVGGFVVFLVLAVGGSFVPVPVIAGLYAKIGILGLMIAYLFMVCVIKVDGKPLMNLGESSRQIVWDMVFLLGVAIMLSSAVTSTESGIAAWIGMTVGPIVAKFGPIGFLVVMSIILVILTNLANNMAVVFIMMNIVASLYFAGLPINLLACSLILTLGSCFAFFTPASSVPGAVLHGGKMVESKALYIWSWIAAAYLLVILLVCCLPLIILGIGA